MKLRQWQSECISRAWEKFNAGENHFLCLATPGAGKTAMASTLASKLLSANLIDLVLCFSPSALVAEDFERTLELHTQFRMDGLLGAKGRSLTYQAMIQLNESFWELFNTNRIFVIFDEIHHCAGDNISNANAWGYKIISEIQGRATYTLALTGTPWRSDQVPIVLSQYCKNGMIQCDYAYGLRKAVFDKVCRTPEITLIDNHHISLRKDSEHAKFTSFDDLLKNSELSYQQLVENEELISYFVKISTKKLDQIRKITPNAGGLFVATSVEHATKIAQLLLRHAGEHAYIATYRENDAASFINKFKSNSVKWIISVGMISEGTNIPRLRVCCHLSRIRTELHFRQILGRILRNENNSDEQGFLYAPAAQDLVDFSNRIETEMPGQVKVNMDIMSHSKGANRDLTFSMEESTSEIGTMLTLSAIGNQLGEFFISGNRAANSSLLVKNYESRLNLYGKFRQQIISMRDPAKF